MKLRGFLLSLVGVTVLFSLGAEVFLRHSENTHRFLAPDCLEVGGAWHHRYKPNCETVNVLHGVSAVSRYNELGLRDRPVSSLPAGVPRILVVGDSNAEGWGLDEDHTIPRRLEERFGNKVVFVNASMRFAGPVIHAMRLPELIEAYHPAGILWLLTEKDFGYDHFAAALAAERDANGFPTRLSTDDVTPLALALKRLEFVFSVKSYLFEYLSQGVTVRRIAGIRRGLPIDRFDPCLGVSHFLGVASEAHVPVMAALMPIGPNYIFENDVQLFPPLWKCVQSRMAVPPIDARIPELQKTELMLPADSHFNAAGARAFADYLVPPLKKFLAANVPPAAKSLRK